MYTQEKTHDTHSSVLATPSAIQWEMESWDRLPANKVKLSYITNAQEARTHQDTASLLALIYEREAWLHWCCLLYKPAQNHCGNRTDLSEDKKKKPKKDKLQELLHSYGKSNFVSNVQSPHKFEYIIYNLIFNLDKPQKSLFNVYQNSIIFNVLLYIILKVGIKLKNLECPPIRTSTVRQWKKRWILATCMNVIANIYQES